MNPGPPLLTAIAATIKAISGHNDFRFSVLTLLSRLRASLAHDPFLHSLLFSCLFNMLIGDLKFNSCSASTHSPSSAPHSRKEVHWLFCLTLTLHSE
ncbi:hypothetical protein AAZX31_10G085500 [Glycine max]